MAHFFTSLHYFSQLTWGSRTAFAADDYNVGNHKPNFMKFTANKITTLFFIHHSFTRLRRRVLATGQPPLHLHYIHCCMTQLLSDSTAD